MAVEEVLMGNLDIRWIPVSRKTHNPVQDHDLEADLRHDGKRYRLLFVVKSNGEPRRVAEFAGLVHAIKKTGYHVFIAPSISSRSRDICKENGIGFVDLQGNALLRLNGIFIERFGKSAEKAEKRTLRNLFMRKSTRIIRIMLSNPTKRWTIGELASEAMVSLGLVHKVLSKLNAEGYLDKVRGATRLKSPGDLLDSWTRIYRFENQCVTGFHSPLGRSDILQALSALPEGTYAVTLGAAASLVAPFVRSTDIYIYTTGEEKLFIKGLGLTPVDFGGNVYIVEPYDEGVLFGKRSINGVTVVSDIQLYLDLFNHPTRGREQAEFLRKKRMGV